MLYLCHRLLCFLLFLASSQFFQRFFLKEIVKNDTEMVKYVKLKDETALVGTDLSLAFRAARSNESPAGVVACFHKKGDIDGMTKSQLRNKIQTLTGKTIQSLAEAMGYKPKDPNEPSMDIDTMRKLASSLVLFAVNKHPDNTAPVPGLSSVHFTVVLNV